MGQHERRSAKERGAYARRTARVRIVTADTPDVLGPRQIAALRNDARLSARIEDPLQAELWASAALGRMWEQRRAALAAGAREWEFSLGAPVARGLARVGGSGAKGLLLAWGRLAGGRFGDLCAELAAGLTSAATPQWVEGVGELQAGRAVIDQRTGDGEVVALELVRNLAASSPARRSTVTTSFTLATFIDARRGGIAKQLALLGPFDRLAAGAPGEITEVGGLRFVPLAPSEACWRIRRAIAATDATLRPQLAEDFWRLRALALFCAVPRPDESDSECVTVRST